MCTRKQNELFRESQDKIKNRIKKEKQTDYCGVSNEQDEIKSGR